MKVTVNPENGQWMTKEYKESIERWGMEMNQRRYFFFFGIPLPPIKYFVGLTPLREWIMNCRPFVPKPPIENPYVEWINSMDSFPYPDGLNFEMFGGYILPEKPLPQYIFQYGEIRELDKNERISDIKVKITGDDYFKNWLNGTFDGSIKNFYLDELSQINKVYDDQLFGFKVVRIHRKCVKSGRINLANRIKEKYPQYFKIKSDAAVAFGMAMMAVKTDFVFEKFKDNGGI